MKRAVIVASGPSLTQEDVDHIKDKAFVIAINESYRMCPWADVLYACDLTWWNYRKGVKEFDGKKYTIDYLASQKFNLIHVPSQRCDFIIGEKYISVGRNSGYQALSIAANMGFKEIILLGFDYGFGLKTHWHGDHPQGMHHNHIDFDGWNAEMEKAASKLKEASIRVINCSRETSIKCFERMSVFDIIE